MSKINDVMEKIARVANNPKNDLEKRTAEAYSNLFSLMHMMTADMAMSMMLGGEIRVDGNLLIGFLKDYVKTKGKTLSNEDLAILLDNYELNTPTGAANLCADFYYVAPLDDQLIKLVFEDCDFETNSPDIGKYNQGVALAKQYSCDAPIFFDDCMDDNEIFERFITYVNTATERYKQNKKSIRKDNISN